MLHPVLVLPGDAGAPTISGAHPACVSGEFEVRTPSDYGVGSLVDPPSAVRYYHAKRLEFRRQSVPYITDLE